MPSHPSPVDPSYFHQRKNLQMMKAAGEVVGKLSSSLQVEVVMHVHEYWIRKVVFLRGAEIGWLRLRVVGGLLVRPTCVRVGRQAGRQAGG